MATKKLSRPSNPTTDYHRFVNYDENRNLTPEKHKLLEESMTLYGFLKVFPVAVTIDEHGNLRIEDGQHRVAFAQKLGLPIYWEESTTRFDPSITSRTVVKWTHADIANKWAKQGKPEYAEVLKSAEITDLSCSFVAGLYAGTVTFHNVEDQFIEGTYAITDRPFAVRALNLYINCKAIGKQFTGTPFANALVACCRVPTFDDKRLLSRLKVTHSTIVRQSRRETWLPTLEAAYNWRMQDVVPLNLLATQAMRERNALTKNRSANPIQP